PSGIARILVVEDEELDDPISDVEAIAGGNV
ncbi:MAG TPA: ABC transporter ATP-binding protein, partial [Rhizobium sp.]|nr:ABC transporter ATP-binding protein [Rhizobium sp.]